MHVNFGTHMYVLGSPDPWDVLLLGPIAAVMPLNIHFALHIFPNLPCFSFYLFYFHVSEIYRVLFASIISFSDIVKISLSHCQFSLLFPLLHYSFAPRTQPLAQSCMKGSGWQFVIPIPYHLKISPWMIILHESLDPLPLWIQFS